MQDKGRTPDSRRQQQPPPHSGEVSPLLCRGASLEQLKRATTFGKGPISFGGKKTLSATNAAKGPPGRHNLNKPEASQRSMSLSDPVTVNNSLFTFSSPLSTVASSISTPTHQKLLPSCSNTPIDLTSSSSPSIKSTFTFSSPPLGKALNSSSPSETQLGSTATFPLELSSSPVSQAPVSEHRRRLKAEPRSRARMVTEREPAQPFSPSKPKFQPDHQHTVQSSPQPEFGKTTLLGANNRPNPFNIPRPNQSRPEHHRAAEHHKPPQHVKSVAHATFDPFRVAKADPAVVPISRPANPTWASKPIPQPTFSSGAPSSHISAPYANPRNFVDLTTGTIGYATNNDLFDERFGAADPYTYVDAAKANENIKALLEGAIEDEEDKPKTRLRKKKLVDEANDIADKLKKLDVGTKDTEAEVDDEQEEDDGTVEGLKVKLLPHQIEGVNWMRDKETGTKKTRGVLPKGGILADDMGLGKTIQSIALLLTNPKPSSSAAEDEKDKTKRSLPVGLDKGTLVVAPLALIKQWEAEIRDRVEDTHQLRVCVHHGPQRAKRSADLKKYDVVITTYQILVSELGNSDDTAKVGCFGVHWYRVILDEAHMIKNRNAKATQAAYKLNAEYRWCLSGTPMQNNLDELQSLIKFLRIKPYDELSSWRDQITRPMNNGRGGLAIKRLQVILKAFMKRRTKDVLKQAGALKTGTAAEKKDGKASSFQITKRQVEKLEADFTPAERSFYQRLEARTDRSIEQMMAGEKMNYANALVLLLRLRQACNHPKLVKTDLTLEKDAMLNPAQTPGKKKVAKDEDTDDLANLLGGLSVATKRCDVCQIELSPKEASSGAIRCTECEADLEDKELQPVEVKKEKKKKLKQKASSQTKSEPSRHRPRNLRRLVLDSDEEDGENAERLVSESERYSTKLGKAGTTGDETAKGGREWVDPDSEEDVKAARRRKRDIIKVDTSDDEASENDDEGEGDEDESSEEELSEGERERMKSLIVSTKIRQLLEILNRESGKYKFIVFSFFTSMLDLIEPFLKKDGIDFTRYDGAMRNDLREASLERLRNNKRTRVLLCSLRAGSLGLNLTAASRVVILEPFWNPFVEEQAIDRVHRLNQTLDVVVYKMTIKDTVEARILALQEQKRELANSTIEGKGAAGKLTLKDMLALFRHDAEHTHKVDGIGLDQANKGRLFGSQKDAPGSTPPSSGQEHRREARQTSSGPPPRRQEDPVFGRRW